MIQGRRGTVFRIWMVAFALAVAATPAFGKHSKTDEVTVEDGSVYRGEIKRVQYASLSLDTDAAGLISIEWRYVTRLTSTYYYRVELSGGGLLYGTLGEPSEPRHLSVVGTTDTTEIDLVDVVEIGPLGQGFWRQLDGSVNLGLTYTGSNGALQYSLSGDAERRTRRNLSTLSGQSILNTQRDGDDASQHELKLLWLQLATNRWGAFELGQLQSNRQQGYNLRALAGGGATDFLIQSSRRLMTLNMGAVYNREDVTGSSDVDESGEILIGMAFRRYKRGSHSPNVQLSLVTFSAVTGESRLRAAFTSNLTWKIVGDLKFNLQVSDNYDSAPPGTEDANRNEVTVVTSIGLTF